MITVKQHRASNVTPLRYPGGKTCLSGYFAQLFEANSFVGLKYVEPYAGGAGAALKLLYSGVASEIVINDLDVSVYAFWKSAVEDNESFVELVRSTEVTIDEWEKQREIYRNRNISNLLELGFAAFFLNRTNRSGILNAGVIGGRQQGGTYKLDARYNKASLIEKLEVLGQYKKSITVTNDDALVCIKKYIENAGCFLYIDPPYYVKGSGLYLNAYDDDDHKKLAELLNEHSQGRWVLSYDNVDEIKALYKDFSSEEFSLAYSAHASSKVGSELMVFSDMVKQI